MRKSFFLLFGIGLLLPNLMIAQEAHISEENIALNTYAFSDPNPIATPSKVYPYFRFDGYTDHPVRKDWKMVVLENDYIKVFIAPEIGGKIWGAIEKSTGKEFVYFNHVVKFRDVAIRGAWTSGGIEINFGTFGHAPSCSTPVDYMLKENEDGSVSCILGDTDLSLNTPWRVEVNLPKDKAYFTTRCLWYNQSSLEEPYYHWMNGGFKAGGNLEFIYPGTHHIGHSGETGLWPLDEEEREIKFYEKNDFGPYKSYHVLGSYTDYFGGYWHDDALGMIHWSPYEAKPGKKIWIWGLSRQGMIWENLLTDQDGQYVELQSGRLFNQAAAGSTFSPFKHRGFAPYTTDTWTEHWYPVLNTEGIAYANEWGALNTIQRNGYLIFKFSPVQPVQDSFTVHVAGKEVYQKNIQLQPLETFSDSISLDTGQNLAIQIGNKIKWSHNLSEETIVNRPLQSPENFDWTSAYGFYLKGKEWIRQREYANAWESLAKCLEKNPHYLPALGEMAHLAYRMMEYDQAQTYALQGLAIDTYDPLSNYILGLVRVQEDQYFPAKEAFSLAAASTEYRVAAYTQLARLTLQEKNYEEARHYAEKSLDYNRHNLEAYQIIAFSYRKTDDTEEAIHTLDKLLEIDPLNHPARFEQWRLNPNQFPADDFKKYIRNEFPHETYLRMAQWYAAIGHEAEAIALLGMAPQQPIISYWLAYLYHQTHQPTQAAQALTQALEQSPYLVFPHRTETLEVLDWALEEKSHWKTRYYQALIYWTKNQEEKAEELFQQCGNEPDYAPFYLARAAMLKAEASPQEYLADLQKAEALSPEDWRTVMELYDYYIDTHNFDKALSIAEKYVKKYPENSRIGLSYARVLLYQGQYAACLTFLKNYEVLPYEGATDGRLLYRNANLLSAAEQIQKKQYKKALQSIEAARQWPENLGAGQPYAWDSRPEDYLLLSLYLQQGKKEEAQILQKEMIDHLPEAGRYNFNDVFSIMALLETNQKTEAIEHLKQWVEQQPENKIALWLQAHLTDNTEKANALEAQLGPDTSFEVIRKSISL